MTGVAPDAVDAEAARAVAEEVQKTTAQATKKEVDATYDSLGTKRGVETMFRTAYRVNMDLSQLADAKANIMISINGLIVSILIASISPGIEKNPWLLLPTSLFLIGCLISLIFAVLAARPRIQTQTITLDDVRNRSANLLFFGNFSYLSRDEFVTGMRELMVDSRALYESMMLDVYGVGVVLQKKYRMLQLSYSAFLVALVVGVLGFISVYIWASSGGAETGIYAPAAGAGVAPEVPGASPGTTVIGQ